MAAGLVPTRFGGFLFSGTLGALGSFRLTFFHSAPSFPPHVQTVLYMFRFRSERKDGADLKRVGTPEEAEAALREDQTWEINPQTLSFGSPVVEMLWKVEETKVHNVRFFVTVLASSVDTFILAGFTAAEGSLHLLQSTAVGFTVLVIFFYAMLTTRRVQLALGGSLSRAVLLLSCLMFSVFCDTMRLSTMQRSIAGPLFAAHAMFVSLQDMMPAVSLRIAQYGGAFHLVVMCIMLSSRYLLDGALYHTVTGCLLWVYPLWQVPLSLRLLEKSKRHQFALENRNRFLREQARFEPLVFGRL
jgi:hypothetical protein